MLISYVFYTIIELPDYKGVFCYEKENHAHQMHIAPSTVRYDAVAARIAMRLVRFSQAHEKGMAIHL